MRLSQTLGKYMTMVFATAVWVIIADWLCNLFPDYLFGIGVCTGFVIYATYDCIERIWED